MRARNFRIMAPSWRRRVVVRSVIRLLRRVRVVAPETPLRLGSLKLSHYRIHSIEAHEKLHGESSLVSCSPETATQCSRLDTAGAGMCVAREWRSGHARLRKQRFPIALRPAIRGGA
ncbi:hypothetical protein SRO_4611 [Streptomyces rochei]|nr:hypothetical protein SRO_4611 [Streptomyces rochei]